MANIIEISDCIGSQNIQKGKFTTPIFDDIRDEQTNPFLYQVLGATLGDLFLTNFNAATPTTLDPRFQVIYDALVSETSSGTPVISKGIKDMVKNVVWFYFARDNNVQIALTGNTSTLSENSNQNADGLNLGKNYNKAIDTGIAIQWYINQNSATYPEYKGQYLDYVVGI